MQIEPIAYARNGFSSKFGIPRQSWENSCIETRIVFEPCCRQAEALRGIEQFSHLWLLWGFSQVEHERHQDTKPLHLTARPPRLGGNTRMGVFATRSPYRPNPIGLTSVRLARLDGLDLIVIGADLMDGTPIYDIKPYLPFSDAHTDARGGYADAVCDYRLSVRWLCDCPTNVLEWEEILSQDPRPAYQDDISRVYKLDYAGYCASFRVEKNTLWVDKMDKIY